MMKKKRLLKKKKTLLHQAEQYCVASRQAVLQSIKGTQSCVAFSLIVCCIKLASSVYIYIYIWWESYS